MSSVERATLTFATYNIHRCFGTDRQYMPERICEILRNLQADVIGLQEVDMRLLVDGRPQLAYLGESLGMHVISGATIPERRSHFGNAIMSRLPVLSTRRADLSIRRFEPRGAIEATLRWGSRGVRVVVTHLGLRAAERRLQVRRLIQVLDQGAHDLPTVLMGDFNEWKPNGGALRALDRRFGPSLMQRTFPARLPILPLDRVWVWPSGGERQISVEINALTRVASDHLPVKAVLSWSNVSANIDLKETFSISKG